MLSKLVKSPFWRVQVPAMVLCLVLTIAMIVFGDWSPVAAALFAASVVALAPIAGLAIFYLASGKAQRQELLAAVKGGLAEAVEKSPLARLRRRR